MSDFTEQLNQLRLLAGVQIKAEHGKKREQPVVHLDEQQYDQGDQQSSTESNRFNRVISGIKQIINACERDKRQDSDPDMVDLCAADKKDWQRILQMVYKDNQQKAQQLVQQLDTASRDYIDIISKPSEKKAVAQYLGIELLKEADDSNRQDTTDQGDHSGMQEWKSWSVTLRTGDGTRTEVVTARSKEEAKRRARQQAPDGSRVSGQPQKTNENVVNEEGAGGQAKYSVTYQDGNEQKTKTVSAGNKAAARRMGPQGKRVVDVQELDTTNEAVGGVSLSKKIEKHFEGVKAHETFSRGKTIVNLKLDNAVKESDVWNSLGKFLELNNLDYSIVDVSVNGREATVKFVEKERTNEAEDKKTFTVWGEVDIKQDTKGKKRDIKASSEEEAEKIMLNNLKQWARTNKQGSAKSARVTRVEPKSRTNEAHYYGTDYYPSHEEDDNASINVVDYDADDGEMDASTNSPDATKTEVPQQTYNRGEESSETQETDVKVPNSISQELKDTIQAFRNEAERLEQRGGSTAMANREFYNNTADAFEDLLGYLELGTVEGIKGAQIYASKLMGPMLHKIPTNTWKFIQRGGINRSLKSYMGQVHDDYPITGPRNTLDDNSWE